jgi:hypothetical protein
VRTKRCGASCHPQWQCHNENTQDGPAPFLCTGAHLDARYSATPTNPCNGLRWPKPSCCGRQASDLSKLLLLTVIRRCKPKACQQLQFWRSHHLQPHPGLPLLLTAPAVAYCVIASLQGLRKRQRNSDEVERSHALKACSPHLSLFLSLLSSLSTDTTSSLSAQAYTINTNTYTSNTTCYSSPCYSASPPSPSVSALGQMNSLPKS